MSRERDPNGIDQHAPGAKLDDGKPYLDLVFSGFARALMEVANVGTYGAKKYTPNGWKRVQNGRERYRSAMMRHYLAGATHDHETGLLHSAHLAWNALAQLELEIEELHMMGDGVPAPAPKIHCDRLLMLSLQAAKLLRNEAEVIRARCTYPSGKWGSSDEEKAASMDYYRMLQVAKDIEKLHPGDG